METKSKIIKQNELTLQKSKNVIEKSPEQLKRVITEVREKVGFCWFSIVPLEEFSLNQNKGEFSDALRLWYAKELCGLSSQCPCGQ